MTRMLSKLVPDAVKPALRKWARGTVQSKFVAAGNHLAEGWADAGRGERVGPANATSAAGPNPLREFFDARKTGRGIWKWRHYLDIYHRHLAKFRGQSVNVLEIGIYSGGSLDMWRDYFGPGCRLFGVDIEPACKAYEDETTRVFIGDQADRGFWRRFRGETPPLDVVIDDGGHTPVQQATTVSELLPHLRPGGVYICEDVHGQTNPFLDYVHGLARNLSAWDNARADPQDPERVAYAPATPFQANVHSVHLYPYLVVVERAAAPVAEFVAPKHGTQWQPFLEQAATD